jgi:N-dimethylarginine dimethylaminohydrolase
VPSKKALVRRPGPRLAEGLVTHGERAEVDPDRAAEQWEAYVDALRAHGWQTLEVDTPSLFPRFLPVPEPSGARVVLLGGSKLLMAASAPRTAELLAGLGHEPVPVDIGEFEKLEGCVTCLSVRLRELHA